MNFGIRWEIYFPQYVNGKDKGGFLNLGTGEILTAGENGVSLNGNINTAMTHFAPRLGISYQVTDKMVIRTGYGRSYDVGVFGTSFGHNVTQNLPVLAIQAFTPASNYLSVFTLASGPSSTIDPSTILASQPKGATGNPLLPSGITPNVLPLTADRTMRLPVVDAWNITLERQLASGLVASIAYVGNKGTHVTPGGTNYNINQANVIGFGTLSSNQRKLFFQKYGWSQSIKYFSDDGTMHFNSLQARAQKRFSHGLLFQANYTWSSAFDFANDYFFWNPKIDYGPEDGIRRHVFTAAQVYELPFGRGRQFLRNAARPVDLAAGRLAAQRNLGLGIRTAVHAELSRLRPGPRHRPLQAESSRQRECFRSQRAGLVRHRPGRLGSLAAPRHRNIRKRPAKFAAWPALVQLGHVAHEELRHHGATQSAVPRRILQHVQPREPGTTRRSRRFPHGRQDLRHRQPESNAAMAIRRAPGLLTPAVARALVPAASRLRMRCECSTRGRWAIPWQLLVFQRVQRFSIQAFGVSVDNFDVLSVPLLRFQLG